MATKTESNGSEEPEVEEMTGRTVSRESTVPTQAVMQSRADLMDLAVRFLSNPRVAGSPTDQKRAFLRKKGLTDIEIGEAIKLSGVPATNHGPPLPVRTLTSTTTSWWEYALLGTLAGGAGYALYHVVKRYVLPWFQGSSQQEQRLADIQSSVEQLETNIRDVVTSINESTNTLRELLSEQQHHLQLLSSQVSGLQSNMAGSSGGTSLREIKEDVNSLKGLLLNRHQFPPTPTRNVTHGSSGIPHWQRAQVTPVKTNGVATEVSSNGSSPETVGGSGLVNRAESEVASNLGKEETS